MVAKAPVVDEDNLTKDDIEQRVETFARTYKGTWMWFFGYGQNCHSFQIEMMKYVGLADPRSPAKKAWDTCVVQ